MRSDTWLVVICDDFEDLPALIRQGCSQVEQLCIVRQGMTLRVAKRQYVDSRIISETEQIISSRSHALLEALVLSSIRKTADSGFVIYRHSAHLLDLCRRVLLLAEVPFGIWFHDNVVVSWVNQHLLACAAFRFCLDEDTLARFRSRHVFDCEYVAPDSFLPEFKTLASRDIQHSDLDADRTPDPDVRKTLLISYYMPPAETVAVHRLNYWEEMLPKIAKANNDPKLEVTALTAVQSYRTQGDYIFVRDEGGLNCRNGQTIELADRLRATRINYFAVYWADKIQQMFEANPDLRYDHVVISGNPFYYFELGAWFKNKWGATVVVDFRDPFANNPRFKYTDAHKALATELERSYINAADYAVSVNQYCVDALVCDDPDKGHVVANGYDERVVDTIEPIPARDQDDRVKFVYTGSFYADRDPEPFLAALNPERHQLVHIGRTRDADAHLDAYPGMCRYGLMPYEDVIGYCKSMDVGIIFTSGAAFEQTTKIFDYIATALNIVIVTDGEPMTGELHNLTQDMEGVHWVRNNHDDITAFFDTFEIVQKTRSDEARFSRYHQSERLYELLTQTAR